MASYLLGYHFCSPFLLILFIFIILVWPTDPLPIEEVFPGACASEYRSIYVVGDREHSFAMFPQGSWYKEEGDINVPLEVAKSINESLSFNPEYQWSSHYFEKFIVGKVLAYCEINLETGNIKYRYVLW